MGNITVSSTISGTLDGVTHSVTGAASLTVDGCAVETISVTTAYAVLNVVNGGRIMRALIYNEGDNEVKVRVERSAGATWQYFNIPAGRVIQIFDTDNSMDETNIESIAVKTLIGVSRVVTLQAWR